MLEKEGRLSSDRLALRPDESMEWRLPSDRARRIPEAAEGSPEEQEESEREGRWWQEKAGGLGGWGNDEDGREVALSRLWCWWLALGLSLKW